MTRGRLIARTAAACGLSTTVGTEELTFLQEWANEAVIRVLLKTRCHVEIGQFSTIANVSDYRLDPSVLGVLGKSVVGGNNTPITVVSTAEIQDRRRSLVATSGDVPTAIATEGDLAMVWPTPTGVSTVRYLYVAKPAPMTNDAHDPSNVTYGGVPEEYHLALEYYMLWRAAEYDEKKSPMGPEDYLKLFEKECIDVRKENRHKAGRQLSPARVGYPGTGHYPRRNDTYP